MDNRASLDVFEKRKVFCLCQDLDPGLSSHCLVSVLAVLCWFPKFSCGLLCAFAFNFIHISKIVGEMINVA